MCSLAYDMHLTIPGLAGSAAQVETSDIEFGTVIACQLAGSVSCTKHVLSDSICGRQDIT